MISRESPHRTGSQGLDRRRWLALAAGTLGMFQGVRSVRSSADQPDQARAEADPLKIDPNVIWYKGYRIQTFAPVNRTGRPVPLVFLFGGNGMGAVVRSVQADQLGEDLARRGIAAAIVNYPNLTGVDVLADRIIAPMQILTTGPWAKRNRVDTNRLGVAGFSAGGLIATLLTTRFRDVLPFELRSSLNFYGPVDLKEWFAFHQARNMAFEGLEVNARYQGMRGPNDLGNSPHGPVPCHQLSLQLRKKVYENLGGSSAANFDAFSEQDLWSESDPGHRQRTAGSRIRLVGAFGTLDDNCDGEFQPRVMKRLGEIHRTETLTYVYEGPHGVSWRACPQALEAFLQPLTDDRANDDSIASNFEV